MNSRGKLLNVGPKSSAWLRQTALPFSQRKLSLTAPPISERPSTVQRVGIASGPITSCSVWRGPRPLLSTR